MTGRKTKDRRRLACWLIIAILFPFLFDMFYGQEWLRWYPNYFSAEAWFSFVGSYLPATLLGIVTLYQSHIISVKDQELRRMAGFPKCIPKSAGVSWDPRGLNLVNERREGRLYEVLRQTGQSSLIRSLQYCIYITFDFTDINYNIIESFSLQQIEWRIGTTEYVARFDNQRCFFAQNEDFSCHIGFFLDFRVLEEGHMEDDFFEVEFKRLLNNYYRRNPEYLTSRITCICDMSTASGECYEVEISMSVSATEDIHHLRSSYQSYQIGEKVS